MENCFVARPTSIPVNPQDSSAIRVVAKERIADSPFPTTTTKVKEVTTGLLEE